MSKSTMDIVEKEKELKKEIKALQKEKKNKEPKEVKEKLSSDERNIFNAYWTNQKKIWQKKPVKEIKEFISTLNYKTNEIDSTRIEYIFN